MSKARRRSRGGTPRKGANWTVERVFEDAQRSFANHHRCLVALRSIHHKKRQGFGDSLKPYIDRMLLVFKREAAVERLVDFVSKFATESTDDADQSEERDEFASFMIRYLLTRSNAKDKAVRFRAIQLVASMLSKMGEDAEISEDIFDSILKTMLVRVRDKVPAVRAGAVSALSRLQDPSDEDDPVLQEYLRLLTCDSSKDVRKTVLQHIGISKLTLPAVLGRARDVNADVRSTAFEIISEKVDLRALSIVQRVELLKSGLQDRDKNVKTACASMLSSVWLKAKQGDIVKLLCALAVDSYPEVAESAVKAILDSPGVDLSGTTQPPYLDDILPEQALYWRICCLRAQAQKQEELMDRLVPDTVQYVEVLDKAISLAANVRSSPYTCDQLLKLALLLDYSDEAGRRQMCLFLQAQLRSVNVNDELVSPMVNVFRRIETDTQSYMRVMMEVLGDIHDPLTAEDSAEQVQQQAQREEWAKEMADIARQLAGLDEEKKICIETEDYARAAEIKTEREDLLTRQDELEEAVNSTCHTNERAWQRMLALIEDLLQHTQEVLQHAALRELVTETVFGCVAMEDPLVRNAAVRCMGVYGLLDRNVARNNMFLVMQVINNDVPLLQLTALKLLFDWLLRYPKLLEPTADSAANADEEAPASPASPSNLPSLEAVVSTLAAYLAASDSPREHRNLVIEGLAKLMVFDRVQDANILTLFFLLFFNPETVKDHYVRQCLSVFFPAFTGCHPAHVRQIQSIVLPALQAVTSAPKSSPIAKISSYQMAQYFVSLLASAPQQEPNLYSGNDVSTNADSSDGDDADDEEEEKNHANNDDSKTPAAKSTPFEACYLTPFEELGFQLCYYLIAHEQDSSNAQLRAFCQVLKILPWQQSAQRSYVAKALQKAIEDAKEGISDKMGLRYLEKALVAAKAADSSPDEPLPSHMAKYLENHKNAIMSEAVVADVLPATPAPKKRGQRKAKRTAARKTARKTARKNRKKKLRGKHTRWSNSSMESFTDAMSPAASDEESKANTPPVAAQQPRRQTTARKSKSVAQKKREAQIAALADIDKALDSTADESADSGDSDDSTDDASLATLYSDASKDVGSGADDSADWEDDAMDIQQPVKVESTRAAVRKSRGSTGAKAAKATANTTSKKARTKPKTTTKRRSVRRQSKENSPANARAKTSSRKAKAQDKPKRRQSNKTTTSTKARQRRQALADIDDILSD